MQSGRAALLHVVPAQAGLLARTRRLPMCGTRVCGGRKAAAPRKAVRSMAAPQFSAPDSVRPSRPKRRFSLAEANRSLPLVKRVVGDIVKTHALAMKLQHEVERQSNGKQQQKQQTQPPTPASFQEQL